MVELELIQSFQMSMMDRFLAAHATFKRSEASRKRKAEDEATDSKKNAKTEVPKGSAQSSTTSQPTKDDLIKKTPVSLAGDAGKPCGLINYRNADFANAVLQCLVRCDELVGHYASLQGKALSDKDIWGDYPLTSLAGKKVGGDWARDQLGKSLFNILPQM